MTNAIINKLAAIERCLLRVKEEYGEDFRENFTKQDSVILNIERACEASIDIGNHLIRTEKLGLPQSTRDVFELLYRNEILTENLAKKMKQMVGFRNVAVHDYQSLNLDIVVSVVETRLQDFRDYAKAIMTFQSAK
jgi:uncharacterized protein YutE (UPF0331/DUF86 family)